MLLVLRLLLLLLQRAIHSLATQVRPRKVVREVVDEGEYDGVSGGNHHL